MQVGIQTPEAVASLEKLNLADRSIDSTNTFTSSLSEDITSEEQRFYSYLTIQIGGGTVANIQVTISRFIPAVLSYQPFLYPVIANPGFYAFGPVYIPPGSSIRVRNTIVGGAGDNMYVAGWGFQAPAGVAMPLTPPLYINNT
jgi:hypothetical protein